MHEPVVIVGGGIAGLVCARNLHRAGVPFSLFEAADEIGGRLRTDEVDGFRLNRGVDFVFDASPNAASQLDFASLDMRPLPHAISIFTGQGFQVVDWAKPLRALRDKYLTVPEAFKLANWQGDVSRSIAEIRGMEDVPTPEMLHSRHYPEGLSEKYFMPYLGTLLFDRDLGATSCRQFMFLCKLLVAGSRSTPAGGVQEITKRLASDLPRYQIHRNARVREILRDGGRASGVVLDTNERAAAPCVVIATDALTAASLSGLETVADHASATTIYFETPVACMDGAAQAFRGSVEGCVEEVVPISNLVPECAPSGRHLAAVRLLGNDPRTDDALAEAAKSELERWFPKANVPMWKMLKVYRLPFATFRQPAGIYARLPHNTTDIPGLFFAGEFTTNGSLDGAVESGMRCAKAVQHGLRSSSAA